AFGEGCAALGVDTAGQVADVLGGGDKLGVPAVYSGVRSRIVWDVTSRLDERNCFGNEQYALGLRCCWKSRSLQVVHAAADFDQATIVVRTGAKRRRQWREPKHLAVDAGQTDRAH